MNTRNALVILLLPLALMSCRAEQSTSHAKDADMQANSASPSRDNPGDEFPGRQVEGEGGTGSCDQMRTWLSSHPAPDTNTWCYTVLEYKSRQDGPSVCFWGGGLDQNHGHNWAVANHSLDLPILVSSASNCL